MQPSRVTTPPHRRRHTTSSSGGDDDDHATVPSTHAPRCPALPLKLRDNCCIVCTTDEVWPDALLAARNGHDDHRLEEHPHRHELSTNTHCGTIRHAGFRRQGLPSI